MTGVRYQSADGIATLTLDEVENKNALSATLVRGLNGALERALADPDVRAIVITNDGNTFCAGADLRAGAERSKTDVVPVFNMILDAPKPVVARIAGHCVAGVWVWLRRAISPSSTSGPGWDSPRSGSVWCRR
ncbi:enoyl-CoA hydratase/isomerase family protein [Mycolicibacterium holsaticum DSM 44478 = JCM 12374]|nr:enoyl-CoA hydratase/isomerase family protein [Mycolicibacterium holsaticum DSM 44478 = JCM 12374]